MIKNIIFDFDGVICESVNIKTEAFYEMYLPYGETIASLVKEHHIANGGMSRFDKFKYYQENFLNKEYTLEDEKRLSTQFSSLVLNKVIEAPFVDGVLKFLEESSTKYKCFIVSATPMDEMRDIASKKDIAKYFKEIFGSPTNKIEWGKYILSTYNIEEKETLFIGDAMSDYKASVANSMHFLLRNTDDNRDLFLDKELNNIDNFINLNDFLEYLV